MIVYKFAEKLGIGGMAGAVAGTLVAKVVGYVLHATGSYFVPFVIAATACMDALAVMQMIVPQLVPVRSITE